MDMITLHDDVTPSRTIDIKLENAVQITSLVVVRTHNAEDCAEGIVYAGGKLLGDDIGNRIVGILAENFIV